MDELRYFEVKAVIDLADSLNTQIEVYLNDTNKNNYITNIDINEELKSHGSVFGVTTNSMTLRVQSLDKSLFPDNENSTYYNYMNDKAIIKLYYRLESNGTWVPFGIWYVVNWYSSISSSDPYSVTIECKDILGKILNSTAPNIDIPYNMNLIDYINLVMIEINKGLADRYKIEWEFLDINKYNVIKMSSNIYDTVESLFNTLSKDFLIDIYVNRNGRLVFDSRVNKNITQYELSDSVNVFSASINNENLTHSDIKLNVSYNRTITDDNVEIYSAELDLINGTNKIDVQFNTPTFKINYIVVNSSDNNVYIGDIRWFKKNASIDVIADGSCKATIKIYGWIYKEYTNFINYGTGSEVIDIENKTLQTNLINSYVVDLYNELIRNRAIQCNSMITPEIKLGDDVSLTLESIGIQGRYKVIRLNWSISTSIDCAVTLI